MSSFIIALFVLLAGCSAGKQPPNVSRGETKDKPGTVTKTPSLEKKPLAAKETKEEFAFAVMGDCRGGGSIGVNVGTLTKALDHVAVLNQTKLVLFIGDMVAGSSSVETLEKQLAGWNEVVEPYRNKGIEFLVTSGNHEIQDNSMREYEPERFGNPTDLAIAHQKVTMAAFPNMPKNGSKDGGLTYWTKKGNLLFIMLDSFRPGYFNTVDMEWLNKTLNGPAMEPRPLHIFVATHSPAFPAGGHMLDSLPNYNLDREEAKRKGVGTWPWKPGQGGARDVDVDWRDKRDAFWQVLVDHKVTAFLTGHEHNLSYQRVDGVWQFISGALTERLYPENKVPIGLYDGKPQNPRAGNTYWHGSNKVWGYFLISVKGDRAEAFVYGWTSKNEPVHLIKRISL